MEEPVRQVACAYCKRRRRRRRRRRLARRAKELLRQRSSADDETWLGVNHVKEHTLNNGDPDDEVNRMGSMDDNVEDKQSQIQPIEIKINLVNKQVMSMD